MLRDRSRGLALPSPASDDPGIMDDHPPDRSAVSLTTAADQLGLTVEATRSRCRRGTLPCQRLPEGGWVVTLTDQVTGERPVAHPSDRPVTGQETATLVALVERQAQQIAELSATAAVWQERARLLGERLQALESGPLPVETMQVASQDANRAPVGDENPTVVSAGLLGWVRRLIGR